MSESQKEEVDRWTNYHTHKQTSNFTYIVGCQWKTFFFQNSMDFFFRKPIYYVKYLLQQRYWQFGYPVCFPEVAILLFNIIISNWTFCLFYWKQISFWHRTIYHENLWLKQLLGWLPCLSMLSIWSIEDPSISY